MIDPGDAIAAANASTNDTLIHFVLGGPLAYLIADKLYRIMRERKSGGATVEYWNQMKLVVTGPLSEVLDRQTQVLEKQVDGNQRVMEKLVALDERTRNVYMRRDDAPPYNGIERRRRQP